MRRCLCLLTATPLLALSAFAGSGGPSRGAVLYRANFDGTNALGGWSGKGALEPGFESPHSLAITAATQTRGATVSRTLPVGSWRGCTVRGTGMVRAQDVTPKPQAWNGIKLMLVVQGASGKIYPQAPLETGSFSWKQTAFRFRVPEDATNLVLVLGLEEVTGKVWFDDLEFKVVKPPVLRPPAVVSGPIYKGHHLERLRGAMISPNIDTEGLRVLGSEWHANLIRFQLIKTGGAGQEASLDAYDTWLEGELGKLDRALPACAKFGLKVVVDLHSPPGGRATAGGYMGSDGGLFQNPEAQEKFMEVWKKIARRYRDAKPIWGYDLANEPVEGDVGEKCEDWQGLAERTARAIREIDPTRTLIIEPADWGGPDGFKELQPLPGSISNVVYSVHMYMPHAFTHQGVFEKGPAWDYPGVIQGKRWDKAELERALRPVMDFQDRYRVHIYVGEFSAIRWAPNQSAERYLSDLIEIFEKRGWDWSYHAFREWQGWSVEHGEDRQNSTPTDTPTQRQRLLRGWFEKNQKPE